jgi:heme exporter protein D
MPLEKCRIRTKGVSVMWIAVCIILVVIIAAVLFSVRRKPTWLRQWEYEERQER